MNAGPDSSFPYLNENERFQFPPPEKSKNSSIIAWGGNLSPGMLLSAYEQGLFPWYSEGEPVLWHSPEPRFVIFPEKLHISRSMNKIIKQNIYKISLDTDFEGVIRGCAGIERPGQGGTWITNDIIDAYTTLHRLGWAHSAEARLPGQDSLAGGCYGIRLGNVFFGESMFSLLPNASKTAFLKLAMFLFNDDTAFIDCQTPTVHLGSMGGEKIARKDFIGLLKKNLLSRADSFMDLTLQDSLNRDFTGTNPDRRGIWTSLL